MARSFLLLLLILTGHVSVDAKWRWDPSVYISPYNHQDNSDGAIEYSSISIICYGIIAENNSTINPAVYCNKHAQFDSFYSDRHYKSNFSVSRTNLLTRIKKDIYFLSVLLI